MSTGYREGINPTRYFEHNWYAWQNPDSLKNYSNPYLHYLDVGRFQGRDPSPLVDMIRYSEFIGDEINVENQYKAILKGVRSAACGVYESMDDLPKIQSDFISAISVIPHKAEIYRPCRPYLVFLQTGPQSVHRKWFSDTSRNWDLMVNYYNADGYDPGFGDYVFFQPGTKFTGIHKIWNQFHNILRQYRYILFLDDDILVSVDSLNSLFKICEKSSLDLAQMSLSKKSHCVWPVLFNKQSRGLRPVDAVEIMMPVVSRYAMQQIGDCFRESVSGFGLDLYFGKKLLNESRNNIAVIDEVIAEHEKPIDSAGGSYYKYMRSRLINPKAELWNLITKYDLENDIYEL